MNLKDAFRYQNKLDQMIDKGKLILQLEGNITTVTSTYLRHKVDPDVEDYVVEEKPDTVWDENITPLCEFLLFLVTQKESLSAAIRKAKASLPVDIDAESGLNKGRQELARIFSSMASLRSTEVIRPNGGNGYRFNAEGNQVSFRCDVKVVTKINYDRNKVRNWAGSLHKQADEVSNEIDKAIVNTEVDYTPFFDVNLSFEDIFELYNTQQV